MLQTVHHRHPELESRYSPLGTYQLHVSSGAVTTIAAATASAGFLFAYQWTNATANAYVRYVGAKFTLTTAYGAAQETGIDMITAPAYTVANTGGTAVTVTGNKLLQHLPASKLASCRVASTTALTAGTFTHDANPIASTSAWTAAIGAQIADADGGPRALFDERLTGSPLVFAASSGFFLRNTILMGATGVGRWDFTVIWDEGVPA